VPKTPDDALLRPAKAGRAPDWKDWQHVRADLETDSTVGQEHFRCPQCRAVYGQQEVQDSFEFRFEGLDEYPQRWRRLWIRCQSCRHQYLVDDERDPATG